MNGGDGRVRFGTMPDGTPVEMVTLSGRGLRARVLSYGAIVADLMLYDAAGQGTSVVLGFDSLDVWRSARGHFGAVTGRYANRIAGGRFTLDGVEHRLSVNQPPNTLHGGAHGFGSAVWRIETLDEASGAVTLAHTSLHGDQGFPGRLEARVRYSVEDRALRIEYEAVADRATVVNLTNHSYFNLAGAGAGDVLGHEITIEADRFTPVDHSLIPTGELRPVEGTPFDFRTPRTIGARIDDADAQLAIAGGYDHNYVLRGAGAGALALAARVREPGSGRTMEVWTTQPGVQFYSGNFLDGSAVGREGRPYGRRSGLCLETQHFPDSPNRPSFPSTVLRQGDTFRSTTAYLFV